MGVLDCNLFRVDKTTLAENPKRVIYVIIIEAITTILHACGAFVSFGLIIGYFINVYVRQRTRNVAKMTSKRKLVLRTFLYLCITDFLLSLGYILYIILEKLYYFRVFKGKAHVVLFHFFNVLGALIFGGNVAVAAWGLCFAIVLLSTMTVSRVKVRCGIHWLDVTNMIFVSLLFAIMVSILLIYPYIIYPSVKPSKDQQLISMGTLYMLNALMYFALVVIEIFVVLIMAIYSRQRSSSSIGRASVDLKLNMYFIMLLFPFLLSGFCHVMYAGWYSIEYYTDQCIPIWSDIVFVMYYIIIPLRPILNGVFYVYTPFYLKDLIAKYCCTCLVSRLEQRRRLTQEDIASRFIDGDQDTPFITPESVQEHPNGWMDIDDMSSDDEDFEDTNTLPSILHRSITRPQDSLSTSPSYHPFTSS